MNKKLIRTIYCLLVFLFASATPASHAQGGTADSQKCDAKLLKQANVFLQFKNLSTEDEASVLLGSACKKSPVDSGITIAAIAVDGDGSGARAKKVDAEFSTVHVLLINAAGTVVSSAQTRVEEDASMTLYDGRLKIDTAPYKLADGVRAFGVDLYGGYQAHCFEAWYEGYRTLFVQKGSALVPVMRDVTLTGGRFLAGAAVCTNEPVKVSKKFKTSIRVLATNANGLADLDVVRTMTYDVDDMTSDSDSSVTKTLAKLQKKYRGKTDTHHTVMRFDGRAYVAAKPGKPFDEALWAED